MASAQRDRLLPESSRAGVGSSMSGGQQSLDLGELFGLSTSLPAHERVSINKTTYESPGKVVMDVKCCRRQHQVLVNCIRYTLQSWGPVGEFPLSYWIDGSQSLWEPSSPMRVTPELKQALTRAKILSEDCCRELPPLEVALRHAERSEAFADTLNEIQWCTSVVYNAILCTKLNHASTFKDYPWQATLGKHEHALLETAAEEDWQQLMRDFQSWKWSHFCSAEDCGNMLRQKNPSYCLASQLMKRFYQQQLKREEDLTPPSIHFPYEELEGEKGHKSLSWSFDQEVLKHGRPLGSGACGSVSEVTWLGSKYARKIFNAAGLHSFPAEADALVKMSHPHIVKVFAHSEDSLLMDLMYGDLYKFMNSRMKGGSRIQPFSLPAAIDLMLQIADAMSYLHSQKMAHRDLKSANILVNPLNTSSVADDDGFVFAKVADFGLVKTKREITRYSHLTHNVGTRRWMAPEIFRDNMEDDHLAEAYPMKADVYSFGIVCFEILSGEVPYTDVRLSELYSKLTAAIPLRPQLPSSCPVDLASLICACWDADPRKRPAMADVCRVLRYLKGLPTLRIAYDGKYLGPDFKWPFGRLEATSKTQGPLGGFMATCYLKPYEESAVRQSDITSIKVFFRDSEKLEISGIKFLVRIGPDRWLEEYVGAVSGVSTDWIPFDRPSEFLVQVEGSYSEDERGYSGVESLSFITTKQKYGPYGRVEEHTRPFCSDLGRVVGFTGYFQGEKFNALSVETIPNIVGCLRQYLENEDPFV